MPNRAATPRKEASNASAGTARPGARRLRPEAEVAEELAAGLLARIGLRPHLHATVLRAQGQDRTHQRLAEAGAAPARHDSHAGRVAGLAGEGSKGHAVVSSHEPQRRRGLAA